MLLLSGLSFADRPAAILSIADPATSDPLSILVNYGALGIFLVLVATGQFRTKYEVQRLEKQIDRMHNEIAGKDELIRAFQMQLTGHTLPALAQSARVFEAIPTSRADIEELSRVRDEAAALAKALESLSRGEKPS